MQMARLKLINSFWDIYNIYNMKIRTYISNFSNTSNEVLCIQLLPMLASYIWYNWR